MQLGIPKESIPGETRVAATPETVKKYVAQGHQVTVARDAGLSANYPNEAYSAVGATIGDQSQALGAELVLKVRPPSEEEARQMKRGGVLIGMLNPFDRTGLDRLAAAGLTAFAMEAAPRTTRAQSLDVLSSQANLAGYKAVMLAADAYPRIFPMLMTAAGTVKAARVVILGAGVAGLQAIATAKRLGAVVEASDVRPAVKEQIESLGAKFIDVPFETDEEREIAQGVGGYARPMPEAWMKRQAAEVAKRDLHCTDSRAQGPHLDHRRNGEIDEARLSDCGYGSRARRQLPIIRTGENGGQAWCDSGWSAEYRSLSAHRCECALCTQSA